MKNMLKLVTVMVALSTTAVVAADWSVGATGRGVLQQPIQKRGLPVTSVPGDDHEPVRPTAKAAGQRHYLVSSGTTQHGLYLSTDQKVGGSSPSERAASG